MNPRDDGVIENPGVPSRADRIERRTWLKGLAAGVVGAVSAPDATAATTAATPSQSDAEAAAQPASTTPAAPRVLDDHGRRTLTSLAESLVPGSVAAGVVDLIDRVAAVDAPSRQRQLLNAISWFDQEARTTHGSRWIDLDASARHDILRKASQLPESRPPQPAWIKGQPLVFASTSPPGPMTLRDHFDYLRTTVVNAYVSTEPGMKDFGWEGRNAWSELPGCPHPDPEHD